MITVLSYRDAAPEGVTVVDTTSRSKNWSAGLSPFFLGPCGLPDGRRALRMENAWQYSKVYPKHLGADGLPTAEWFEWSAAGFASSRADRYPAGKGAVPAYSWFAGERLDYIQARLRLYFPLYAAAVRATDAFRRLEALYRAEGRVALRDFDGYRHDLAGASLCEVFQNPARKAGHGFVLAALLSGQDVGQGPAICASSSAARVS